MLFHWSGCKNHDFQASPKTSPNVCENVFGIGQISIKCCSGCIVEKTTKNNAKNNTNCTKNHPQGGGPRTRFSDPNAAKNNVLPACQLLFRHVLYFCVFHTFCEHLEIAVLPAWELTLVRFGLTFASILVPFLDTISKKSEFYLHGSSIVLGNCIFTCMGAHFSSLFIVLERSREGKGRKEKRREKNSNQHPT